MKRKRDGIGPGYARPMGEEGKSSPKGSGKRHSALRSNEQERDKNLSHNNREGGKTL